MENAPVFDAGRLRPSDRFLPCWPAVGLFYARKTDMARQHLTGAVGNNYLMLRLLFPCSTSSIIPSRYLSSSSRVTPACQTVFLDGQQFFSQLQHFFAAGKRFYIHNLKISLTIFIRFTGSSVGLRKVVIQPNTFLKFESYFPYNYNLIILYFFTRINK